jgi:hypothetical protein
MYQEMVAGTAIPATSKVPSCRGTFELKPDIFPLPQYALQELAATEIAK